MTTAWGVVAVCGIGGGVAGPFLDAASRRVRRAPASNPEPVAVAAGAGAAPAEILGEAADQPALRRRAAVLEPAAAAVLTGGSTMLAAWRLGATPALAAYCVLFGALVVVSITDVRVGLVPRRVVYPAGALAGGGLVAASAVRGDGTALLHAALGAGVAFGVLGAVWWAAPRAMGFGDVRLAALCGGALGWLGFAPFYLGFLAAFVAGSLIGLVVLVVQGSRRFPFAPALAVGTMFGVLWGSWLGHLWMHPHPL